jgi:two-component system, LytTR family, sensor histidine kinase AgrC
MHGISDFFMTIMESIAFIIVWSSLNNSLKYKNIIKFIIYMILLSIITTSFDYFNVQYSGIIVYIIMYFTLLILFKEPMKQAFMIFLFALIICISVQFGIFFVMKNLNLLSDNIDSLGNATKINSMLIIINTLISFIFPLGKIKSFIEKGINEIIFLLINIILFVIIFKTSWDFDEHFIMNHTITLLMILISLIFTNINFIKITIEKNEHKKINQIQNSYNPIISDLIEDVRRKQHDYKNHMNTIYGIIQTQSEAGIKESVKEYLNSLESSFKDIDLLISMENKILSAIIYSKLCFAKENNIDFKFFIQAGSFDYGIKDYQLSEVLDNLIDNAFEAVRNSNKKDVTLTIGKEKGRSFIEVRNNGELIRPADMTRIFEKGYTSKKDAGREHGYGLYNVKKIIESVKGKIHLSCEDGFMVFKIIL